MKKVNKFGMLIKFATFYLCINLFIVIVSAIPHDKNSASVETKNVESEDYDAMPSDKPTELSSNYTKPPLLFPSDDDKSTSKNDTALEILQKNSNASMINEENSTANNNVNKSSTSVSEGEKDYDDVKSKDQNKTSEATVKAQQESAKNTNDKKQQKTDENVDYDVDSNENNKDDVENIQENQDQGDLEERYGVNSTSINVFEEPTINSGHLAFIFAASLVFLSATAYVGLIIWRKTLEYRYGMRQRLVTEDDYYNNNDVRFFGL